MATRRQFYHIFLTIGSKTAMRLSALRNRCPLPPGRFLILISVRGWVDPRAIVWLEGLCELKKSNDLIGNQTRNLPACSIVPQLTMLPGAPLVSPYLAFLSIYKLICFSIYLITYSQHRCQTAGLQIMN
jgi:hypothetical protein